MLLRRPFPAILPVRRRGACATAVGAALLVAAALPAAAGPVTLTFGSATGSAAGWYEGSYALVSGGACSSDCAVNGGDYLLSEGGSLSITPTRSRVFALTSFDAGGSSADADAGQPQYIDVTGFKWDGSTVSQRFVLDVLQNGATALQTFTLGADFLELRSVSLRNGGSGTVYALDNIRVGDASAVTAAAVAVTEPTTIALVAVALVAVAGTRRRRPPPHGG